MKRTTSQISRVLLISLLISSCSPGVLASDATGQNPLTNMEATLFGHSYVGESDEARVNRLERFVFGEEKTGPVADRIATLKSAAAGAGSTPADIANTDGSQPVAQPAAARQPVPVQPDAQRSVLPQPAPQRTKPANPVARSPMPAYNAPSDAVQDAQANDGKEAYVTPGYGNYPRVTELEQQLLGKTYVNEPLPARVQRLEVKQFGKASTGDVCDRLDKLDQFLKPKTPVADADQSDSYPRSAVSPTQAAPGSSANTTKGATGYVATSTQNAPGNETDPQTEYASGDYGSYPRVNELEEQFLGQKYLSDPLPARVARLETKEFNKTYPDQSLCDRIDRLDQRAKPKKQSREMTADQDGASNGNSANSNNKGSIGGAIGKTLLGLMGGGMGGPFGGGVMGGGMGPGLMMGPGGFGMGPGMMMGPGRSGGGNRNAQPANQTAQVAQAPQNPFFPGADAITGVEERTAAMERFVFGREQGKLSTEERVQRLEKKLVPYEHHTQTEDLNRRVDHLWTMLAAANRQPRRALATPGSTPN